MPVAQEATGAGASGRAGAGARTGRGQSVPCQGEDAGARQPAPARPRRGENVVMQAVAGRQDGVLGRMR